MSAQDPASALQWASSIAGPELRGVQMEQLAHRWLKASPAAAREWLTLTDQLPPAARHRILVRRTPSYYDG